MLSPWTKPGTRVVALVSVTRPYGFTLVEGSVYVVAKMVEDECSHIGVLLEGFPHDELYRLPSGRLVFYCFPRNYFRPLELPSCLTELLVSQPVEDGVAA